VLLLSGPLHSVLTAIFLMLEKLPREQLAMEMLTGSRQRDDQVCTRGRMGGRLGGGRLAVVLSAEHVLVRLLDPDSRPLPGLKPDPNQTVSPKPNRSSWRSAASSAAPSSVKRVKPSATSCRTAAPSSACRWGGCPRLLSCRLTEIDRRLGRRLAGWGLTVDRSSLLASQLPISSCTHPTIIAYPPPQPLGELTPGDSERLISVLGVREKVLRATALILNTLSADEKYVPWMELTLQLAATQVRPALGATPLG
jgi:hypothetical protein